MISVTFVVPGNIPGAPAPENYRSAVERFADTYRKFPADIDHRLHLIDSNGGLTPDVESCFDGIDYGVIKYPGSGWDIGAHHFASLTMGPDDWIMCFSTSAHFRRRGWLKAFVDAREKYGDGLFGSTTSFQGGSPHVRSTGFFVRCERLHRYPHGCNSRDECLAFESGVDSLTQWCVRRGYGVWLVTPVAVVPLAESRNLDNVFRRGDQSNIWTFDRNTDLFESATPERREQLSRGADNLIPPRPPKWRRGLKRIKNMVWSKSP
jgi:hypothetical protein